MSKPQTAKPWYKHGLLVFGFCIGVGVLIQHSGILSEFNQAWIDRDVRNNGMLGGCYFIFMGVLLTGCGAPRQVVAFLGGYAFGFTLGVLLALFATLLGCIMAFYVAKFIARPYVLKRFEKQASRIDRFLSTQAIQKTIVIRLLPVGSNLVTNMAAGLTQVKSTAFFTGSLIGYLPQTVIFALLGKGVLIGSHWKIMASIVLLLVSSYISFMLFKKQKIARSLQCDGVQQASTFISSKQS
ncbi:TVP38/TMEM64 family protein [Paraglaciecola marina]|uniref:TVP38/TMEM64 family protein n=1 Tax=Paraglaciecola marina TaxID=2500157 RepID=UPI001EF121A1|nr:VTT domain-containing protein [Paraglaciecola marina]